jgi:hypothetical protein
VFHSVLKELDKVCKFCMAPYSIVVVHIRIIDKERLHHITSYNVYFLKFRDASIRAALYRIINLFLQII